MLVCIPYNTDMSIIPLVCQPLIHTGYFKLRANPTKQPSSGDNGNMHNITEDKYGQELGNQSRDSHISV